MSDHTGGDNDDYRGSNGLGRQVARLDATLRAFQANWQEQDRRAVEGRRTVYDKVEGFGHQLLDLAHQVTDITKDVAEMRPAVRDWVTAKARAEGVNWAAKVLWAVCGALLFGAGWVIDHVTALGPAIVSHLR
jgi:hypothetical protein